MEIRCVTSWDISAFLTTVLTLELHHVITPCQAFVVVRNTVITAHRVQIFGANTVWKHNSSDITIKDPSIRH